MSAITPLASPLTCPMCYSADLYCKYQAEHHSFDEFPHCYTGKAKQDALRPARKAGWILHRDRTATCPKCARALATQHQEPKS